MKDFDAEIRRRKQEIAELEAERDAFKALTPEHQLAISLHETRCNWNHTDGCGWFYEVSHGVHDWTGYAHAEYLKKARKMMNLLPDFSPEQIIQVSDALRS